ncbi:hypothetical protein HPO_06172 [Hyphomonas polymorpha PS728]|uniref:Uncharacterized protein n=1 Tax=Hyphomonas polymorpha PS728 TaxID=1280954 RepID=A0A062VIX9_9PROT|nr:MULTISPECIES: hypothetical protein [Hyphomonas]AXE63897.1 hypothetical protein BBF93_06465 [Hyphomonas sp. CACIAM 19H1]KCZ99500.1 hypothetical protein HPO_06172 [Hyphomonas polymorpha PS728]
MTEDTSVIAPKAGWHIWLVGILALFWNAFGCFDFVMTATRNEAYLKPYPQEMLDYWFAMPWWVWAVWALGVFGGFFGAAALLLRSVWAVRLFALSLLGAVISLAIGIMATDAPKMEGAEFFPYVIIAIALVQLGYAWWQMKRGVLR